ncbi:MAG: hypothetical protein J6X83_04180 [Methanomicrobium sp.]|nr:hypothetical protein [Methanomicrobium sp.]
MDAEVLASIAEFKAEVREMNRRLEKLETLPDNIHELSTSIKLLAQKQEDLEKDNKSVMSDVSKLKSIPAKRWESLIGYLVAGVVGAILTNVVNNFAK